MFMTPATERKINALKTLVKNGAEIDHYNYSDFYAKHKGEIPSWGTLKKHGVLTFERTGLVLVKGVEAVQANIYKYNL